MAGGRLVVEAAGDGHDARVGVDGKQAAGIVVERVGDRVGHVGIGGQAGHADRGADNRILGHRVGAGIRVGDGAGVELVDVIDRDRQRRGAEAGVARGGPDRDVVAGGRFGIQGAGHGDNARIGVDREQSAGIIIEAVADRIAAVRIGRIGRDADRGTDDGVFIDRIGRGIGVAHRADRTFVDIGDVDRKRLAAGAAVVTGGQDRHTVAGVGLVIEGPVDRHHARIGVDGKPAARIVAEAVGHAVGRIGVGGQAGQADRVPTIASSATVLAAGIGVGHGAGVELVDIADGDRERLGRAAGVACWWPGP